MEALYLHENVAYNDRNEKTVIKFKQFLKHAKLCKRKRLEFARKKSTENLTAPCFQWWHRNNLKH